MICLTTSQFVAALAELFDFFLFILSHVVDLFNNNPVFSWVIALFVLDWVIDLFKYIIKS